MNDNDNDNDSLKIPPLFITEEYLSYGKMFIRPSPPPYTNPKFMLKNDVPLTKESLNTPSNSPNSCLVSHSRKGSHTSHMTSFFSELCGRLITLLLFVMEIEHLLIEILYILLLYACFYEMTSGTFKNVDAPKETL